MEEQAPVNQKSELRQAVEQLEQDIRRIEAFVDSFITQMTDHLTNVETLMSRLRPALENCQLEDTPTLIEPDLQPAGPADIIELPTVEKRRDAPVTNMIAMKKNEGRKVFVKERNDFRHTTPKSLMGNMRGAQGNITAFNFGGPSTSSGLFPPNKQCSVNEEDDITNSEAVKFALKNSGMGALAEEEFLTFLCICRGPDDPVSVAKDMFSVDIGELYLQLTTFSFYLILAHQDMKRAGVLSARDRTLQERLKHIVDELRKEYDLLSGNV